MQYKELRGYGLNIIIRKYANFPQFLPLPCHMEHGWNADNQPLNSELNSKKPLMMVFSKRSELAWKRKSKIPVVIMGMPFVHYKNMHNITKKTDAKGTIAFPCHSTYFLKHGLNIDDYCKELKKLPNKFQPVTICLFWLDYINKSDIYRKYGFEVVTAGYKIANSLEFVKNFYDILSNHKFATSDNIGSHTFYAVDFGLPFFLTGDCSELINKGCRDPNIAERTRIDQFQYGKKARELFLTGPINTISKAQAEYVAKETGINECLSPKKMNKILWKYFNKNHYGLKFLIPYFFTTAWAYILFNGPWIKYLMLIRKWMTDEKRLIYIPKLDKLTQKIHIINKLFKQVGIYNFSYFGFHYAKNAFRSSLHTLDYKLIQYYFENKSGIEIGGPSDFFMSTGPLPIYPVVKTVSNINFHKSTVWTNKNSSKLFSRYKYSLGRQYIADATNLSSLKKKNYDFCLLCNVLEHIANPLLAIEEALKIISDNGIILIVVPKKESNFDCKRPITKFDHLLRDYKNRTKEDDLYHLPEILRLHDLRLDPAARNADDFVKRSMNNVTNRCLHHHVFDKTTLERMFMFFNLNILSIITIHTDYIILGRKTSKFVKK